MPLTRPAQAPLLDAVFYTRQRLLIAAFASPHSISVLGMTFCSFIRNALQVIISRLFHLTTLAQEHARRSQLSHFPCTAAPDEGEAGAGAASPAACCTSAS